MTQPGEQSDGDYGYDLVHEATAGSGRQPVPPAPAEPPAPADEDPGGDLGYDEVHRG